jgi:CheY-like chemotaxis protein
MPEQPHSILVADDDRDVQGLVVLCLERRGYRVLRASDGEEALAVAMREQPDVVLLDVTMPGGGGVQAATALRDALPDVRIVVLSAHEGPDVQVDMARAGAIGYLVKGATDDQIVRAVRSAARW